MGANGPREVYRKIGRWEVFPSRVNSPRNRERVLPFVSLLAAALSCASADGAPVKGASSPPLHPKPSTASAPPVQDSPSVWLGPEVRYAVQLGEMQGDYGPRRDELARVLHDSARLHIQALQGAVVVVANASLVRQASEKGVPVITLDGSVTELTETADPTGLRVRARVEFALRREHVLKATLSGAATATGSSPTISDSGRRRLEEDAIDGAVKSALREADRGLTAATR
jgi:hypothetical protein